MDGFPIHLNTYVLGLQPLYSFIFFHRVDGLYPPEWDVYRRQILADKDRPRAERVKQIILLLSLNKHPLRYGPQQVIKRVCIAIIMPNWCTAMS